MADEKSRDSGDIKAENSQLKSGRDIIGGSINIGGDQITYNHPPRRENSGCRDWIFFAAVPLFVCLILSIVTLLAAPIWDLVREILVPTVTLVTTPTLAPSPTESSPFFALKVLVTDQTTGQPIAGADLLLDYGSALLIEHTGGDGYFTFNLNSSNTRSARLQVLASGYASQSEIVFFPPPNSIKEIRLSPVTPSP